MIVLQTTTYVPGLRGQEIYDFFTHPDDRSYQRWWLGTHLQLHLVGGGEGGEGGVGSEIHMDEYVGRHRVRMNAVVTEAVPGRRLCLRMKKLVRLPATLTMAFDDDEAGGVRIVHTLRAGYAGPGRVLDPLLRLHFTAEFERAMDAHVRTEFAKLRELLHGAAPGPA